MILCCICSAHLLSADQPASTSNGQDTQDTSDMNVVQGSTLITNRTSQKLKVEWQISLSETIKSDLFNQMVPAKSQNFQTTGEAEWFQDHNKGSINPLIYTLTVRTYDVGGTKLSEEDVLITRSYANMTQDKAKNDLLIIINSNYTIDYVLK